MNLTLLAPEIQEGILCPKAFPNVNPTEQAIRKVLKMPIWKEQTKIWDNFIS
jgi:hypothetical protein